MKLIKGHIKVSKLKIPLNADPLALYKLWNLTNFQFIEGKLTFTNFSEGTPTEDIWFTEASAKRLNKAAALNITTGKQIMKEDKGSMQVGGLPLEKIKRCDWYQLSRI